ncbi:uncharacterized protein Z520_10538 [Fonsecaea multimorphosa CBS 102226]|uniref:Nudix hydrolase domain-containing protein n=1 Tax=Fonsecaea multimorphosa CBS 102226 TaxID=1442371 RepID=A0A0D2JK50_9EURO|nr:uncharacterized protein Z520_10538 [Fonsecaea multimorphosa CBS 102226]KIX93632.1 hypothetical protein Z520_10538 [Fonsecaea multimorphosa CBS 102226]OAL19747.1 hypothetical protein AYO22_09274 [Fonsecaea multimorphosa]
MSSSTTTTFTLPNTPSNIPITHPSTLTQDQLLAFPAFKTWLSTLQRSLSLQHTSPSHPFHESAYALRSIEIQSVDFFSGHRLGFLKLKATVTNDKGESLPGSVFMRGGSVAMLIILTPSGQPSSRTTTTTTSKEPPQPEDDDDEEYAILTIQPRIPAGSLAFAELPAGMIDDSGTFAGAAAKEIHEETGLEISTDELIDMTQLAASSLSLSLTDTREKSGSEEEQLQSAIYPSPGGSDEFIPIFLARKTLPRHQIEALKGKLTGLRDHGEKITLKIVKLNDVWKVAWRDGKTLAAMALYQGLKGEGKL